MKLAISFFVFAVPFLVHAKGTYPPGPISDWFTSQHNATGQWCCDQADGHLFYGNYKINADGSVDLIDDDDNGKKYHIDKSQVLSGPEPPGVNSAVWWFTQYSQNQTKYTYCFHLGPEG